MWQEVMQITCNFCGSSIDTRQSVYVSRFESICIPNYRLLVVNEGNEADDIKGSLKRRCRNRWGVFKSPGGLQPIFPSLVPFLHLFLFQVLLDGGESGTILLHVKVNVSNVNQKFLHSRTGTAHRIRSVARENSIFANLRMMIGTANFNCYVVVVNDEETTKERKLLKRYLSTMLNWYIKSSEYSSSTVLRFCSRHFENSFINIFLCFINKCIIKLLQFCICHMSNFNWIARFVPIVCCKFEVLKYIWCLRNDISLIGHYLSNCCIECCIELISDVFIEKKLNLK